MSKAPAFQFYPKDYESDERVKMMTLEQEGAYVRLLCHAWLEGSIPDDAASLGKLCRVSTARMQRIWPGVSLCFVRSEPGRLVNERQERDREALEHFKAGRAESGKRGADSRWHGKAIGSAMREPMANDGSPSPSPSPSPRITATENGLPPADAAGPSKPVVVPPEPTSTASRKATRPKAAPATWLTPFGEAWRERWGAESEPPWGEMAQQFAKPAKELDRDDLAARWERFLAAAERSEWARPARFVQGLGQWADQPGGLALVRHGAGSGSAKALALRADTDAAIRAGLRGK